MDTGITTELEMNAIINTIKHCQSVKIKHEGTVSKIDLLTEVLWSAMKALKENPELSIPQALKVGKCEWTFKTAI